MSSVTDVVRFFLVVPPVSRMMTATFAVLVVIEGAVLTAIPTAGASAIRPILLLQAFAAAAGFTVPARRGHYDLLLTRGHRRSLVAIVQWAVAASPGVASWLALGVVEAAARPLAGERVVLTMGTASAVFVISSVAWALTASLPRFAGAVGWLLVLVVVEQLALDAGLEADPPQWPWAAGRALLAPHTMTGLSWTEAMPLPAGPALLVASVWVWVAVRRITREDFRLDAGQ